MKPLRLRSIPPLAVIAALSGCVLDPGRNTNELDRAVEVWTSQQIGSYQIVIRRSCFCQNSGDPVRVTVTNGQVVSRVFTATGQPVPAGLESSYPDVPGLFELVREAYNDAASITASFDPQRGFPVLVVVDWIKNAVDDEMSVQTSDFATN